MPITSSTIEINNLQIDGRRIICELHIDDGGNQYPINYMADPDMDVTARLLGHADDLNQELAAQAVS